ncbi:Bug family tripartite tricarboxylate transporter substrate binding protein [Comamonas testosteroni]|uniref:Bug family tripartite tricarboxylate transporter substrate binding protein n=1 Tax=Comamonas testosteroni TaxID=285 RepID=UPI0023AABA80|nr:Bug family tripartite tricarboxylate transporter substrate binding protein [Comamonas testosteroni]WEE79810.1 Bug family tripartite tricarboxylate transporter substrate binding protein [Comamonas testosteroni]
MMNPIRKLTRRGFALASASVAAIAFAPVIACAQAGNSPVRIIVGFPPGGSSDVVARQLAEVLRHKLGRTVLVENRAGAAGRIAPDFVRTAAADGSVILLTPNPMITQYQSVYRKLTYDPHRDFTPVAQVATYPLFVSVGPAVPESVKNIRQYLEWTKSGAKNGFFGSPATGSTPHFVGVMLGKSANIELTHVPYKGDAPGIQDLLGGQVPMSINVPAAQLPHVGGGKLRVLATSGAHRSPDLPNTPTLAEQGFPSLQTNDWFGVFVPAATPASVVQQLQGAFGDALASSTVRESFLKLGIQPAFLGSTEFTRRIKDDSSSFAALVKSVGFVPEE